MARVGSLSTVSNGHIGNIGETPGGNSSMLIYLSSQETNFISNHCFNLQYDYISIQIETDENKLVIVEDVPEKTTHEQNQQNHRFYCLPCKQNFSESDDYTKHMSR